MNKDVDTLGYLKADIKALQDQAKVLETKLKTAIDLDGQYFTAAVAPATRTTVNWKKIANDLKASAVRIAKNTKFSEYVQVRVFAHSQSKAA